jgi:hypothetical protein
MLRNVLENATSTREGGRSGFNSRLRITATVCCPFQTPELEFLRLTPLVCLMFLPRDKARSRERSELGLSIVKWVVEAHPERFL